MKKSCKGIIWLRVILTALCVGAYAFIFYNSAQSGEQSSAQSGSVVAFIQRVFKVIAPNSFIATAQGQDYQKLHAIVRTLAHFAEFTLLGALLIWCFASYTDRWFWFIVPLVLILLSPIMDECIQLFASARVADLKDIGIDTLGGYVGALFAWFTLVVAKRMKKERENGKKRAGNCTHSVQQKDVV